MSQKEIVLEEDGVEAAENAGWLVRKMQFIGRRGCPDRFFWKRRPKPCPHCGTAGDLHMIEFKRKGKGPDGKQQREHDKLRGQGWPVHVIDTWEDFCKLLGLKP